MREMSRKELIFLKDMLKKVQKFIWERGSGRVPYCYVRFEYMFHNIEIYLQSGEENLQLLCEILQRDWEKANHQLVGISSSKLMNTATYEKMEDAIQFIRMITEIDAFFQEDAGTEELDAEENEEDETFLRVSQSNR